MPRAGQIALEALKVRVLGALTEEGLTLDQIVARPDIAAEIASIYGSNTANAKTVIKHFLACGLDTRVRSEGGRYFWNPGGVDGRASVCSTTLAQVSRGGVTCVVQNPLLLAEFMFGRKGRSGAHAALLQNNGRGNRYGGFEWTVVSGLAPCSAAAAHALFSNEVLYVD
jgi:hypothetical protein